jgi:polyhydroxybutyrate depolymerase
MIFTLTVLALMAGRDNPMLKPGNHTRTLEVDRRSRTYLIHVPASYDGSKPYPVVLVFHGGASNAEQMVRFCGLNDKADQAGFLVVYPEGTGQRDRLLTWNGGNCCGYAMLNRVDDVGFVRALLDDLGKVARVDPKRIFATGMSNGAIMAYRLASELSDRIAAIAPVSGPMGTETCTPRRPVSVIHFHGTQDEFAPLEGGRGKKSLSGTNFYSGEHSIRQWVKADGCPEQPTTVRRADRARDGTTIVRKIYGPGKDGAEVVLIVIEGGGHTWPGREPPLKILGKSTRNLSANDAIWEFFERHAMK